MQKETILKSIPHNLRDIMKGLSKLYKKKDAQGFDAVLGCLFTRMVENKSEFLKVVSPKAQKALKSVGVKLVLSVSESDGEDSDKDGRR
eukprot:3189052-Prymnesium_polylepis.1